jgi:uncharacterized membrane protein/NAD(P)-dependent dehydrogenase (short-subunit alcohol dehydrogenase family)
LAEKANNFLVGAVLGASALATLLMVKKSKRRTGFNNKVVIITGGSRGLGLVLARTFAGEGAKLAICARHADELERAKQELESLGAEVFSGVCDVREREQVENFIESVINHFGRIDVLVNNAGVIQVGPLEVQTKQDFEDAMAVHFWGPFHTIQAVTPHLKKQGGGNIVNISSIGGKMSVPHLAPYCASKFALVGLSNAMRVELAKDNIVVTTVCPGLMRTGSHINAIFKGKNQLEFALFSTMNALPFTSVSAEKAAKEIIEATRRGDAEAIISIQEKLIKEIKKKISEKGGKMNTEHTENSIIENLTNLKTNVGSTERIVSTVAGGALIGYGLIRRDKIGIILSLLGSGLAFRGTTGHCSLYDALDVDTTYGQRDEKSPFAGGWLSGKVHVTKSVTINKSPAEIYQFWRNVENLPQFMKHLESVKRIDNMRSHWTAKAPLGTTVEWTAEITSDVENERIGWKSVENSSIPNSGVVEFLPTADRGTEVRVNLTYEVPAGKFASLVAKVFGEEPNMQVAEDLRRLKQLLESGTIMTVEGQPSGRAVKAQ